MGFPVEFFHNVVVMVFVVLIVFRCLFVGVR